MAKPHRRLASWLIAIGASAALSACATVPPPSPISVTRFHDSATLDQIGAGIVFIENAPGSEDLGLELAPYKAAIAAELAVLGYQEGTRSEANAIAQISVERFQAQGDRGRRGPVSVGVGGGTGSYGSGVGLGIGINLGGGSNRPRVGTELSVTLRPVTAEGSTSRNLWEGRAQIEVTEETPEANPTTIAPILAKALFREFPGGNGDTVAVELKDIETSE